MNFITYTNQFIRYSISLIYHRNTLPEESNHPAPKLEIEGMSWVVYWEDEGLPVKSYILSRAFLHVMHYRMCIIRGDMSKAGEYGPAFFNKRLFQLAKKCFPNWIGFRKERCSYNPELADRILRMEKVAEWRVNKLFDEA